MPAHCSKSADIDYLFLGGKTFGERYRMKGRGSRWTILYYRNRWTDSRLRWTPNWPYQVEFCGFGQTWMGFTRLAPRKTVPGPKEFSSQEIRHWVCLRSESDRLLLWIDVLERRPRLFPKTLARKLDFLGFMLCTIYIISFNFGKGCLTGDSRFVLTCINGAWEEPSKPAASDSPVCPIPSGKEGRSFLIEAR